MHPLSLAPCNYTRRHEVPSCLFVIVISPRRNFSRAAEDCATTSGQRLSEPLPQVAAIIFTEVTMNAGVEPTLAAAESADTLLDGLRRPFTSI